MSGGLFGKRTPRWDNLTQGSASLMTSSTRDLDVMWHTTVRGYSQQFHCSKKLDIYGVTVEHRMFLKSDCCESKYLGQVYLNESNYLGVLSCNQNVVRCRAGLYQPLSWLHRDPHAAWPKSILTTAFAIVMAISSGQAMELVTSIWKRLLEEPDPHLAPWPLQKA